jgi:hypothetical protein
MKKRRKSRNYYVTGSIEVCNITTGRRKVTILQLNKVPAEEIIEYSGSIVTKNPIYNRNITQDEPQEEIFSSGSGI